MTRTQSETKRCAIYTRKSTTMGLEQDFNSLDAQRETCIAYIQRQPGWIVVDDTYSDGGFTGTNIERPAFQRLLADVDAGKIDVVVTYKVDRLSRSLMDFAKVMERFSVAGVSFVSVTQNFSTADAMGRLTLNMLMSFAQFEAEMIAERTRDKLALARQKGKWTGGPVPFGYSTQDKRLVVNEQEALVVREVFELFLQHQGMAIVARKLNERRLLPRDVGRTPKHGIRWSKDAVSRLLHNPIYIGKMMYCNTVYPGEHPALVDEATFRRAQRILEGGSRELRFAGGNPDYVLRGLLFCGACGGAMTPASTRRGKKQWRYYRCAGRDKHGGAVCRAKPLAADAIESFVVQRVAAVTQDGALAAEVKARLTARLESRTAELEMLQRVLPDRIADASTKVSRYADEMLKFEGRAREAIEAKLCAASELLAADERQLATVQRDMIDLRDATIEAEWIVGALAHFASIWDAMTPENRGRLLRALVASVRVHEGKVDIEFVDFAGDSETAQVEAGPKEAA